MFQKTVNRQFTTGFPGELIEDGPKRARTARIMPLSPAAATQGDNTISRAFGFGGDAGDVGLATSITQAARVSEVVVGGAEFFGILGHPKHHALFGSAGDSLAASYNLPDGAEGEFFDMATGLVVELFNFTAAPVDVGFGWQLAYVTNAATALENANDVPAGGLIALAPGAAAPAGTKIIPNARVVNTISLVASAPDAPVAGVTIVQLTQ
jgi:hypothetical protein